MVVKGTHLVSNVIGHRSRVPRFDVNPVPGFFLASPSLAMANGIIKLALVAAISIQAVLWSHSRQAAVDLHSAHHRPSLRLLARQWATSEDPMYHISSNVTLSDVFINSHDTVRYVLRTAQRCVSELTTLTVSTNFCTNRSAM